MSDTDLINDLLERAIAEDLGGEGDITSKAVFPERETAEAVITAQEPGVLSGVSLLSPLFSKIDPAVELSPLLSDGAPLSRDDRVCRLCGPVRSILSGERIALNFLQRLSGIATLTSRYRAAIAHTKAKLLDTRKTTPTLRLLEKAAVRHGGGENHRFGLYDMILIKDTHVRRAGGVATALRRALDARGGRPLPKIEVEVQTVAEFAEALDLGPDRIMLDNMDIAAMRRCVERRHAAAGSVEIEASGSITLETIVPVAESGVDFISCGSLTHSAPALDIHLTIV